MATVRGRTWKSFAAAIDCEEAIALDAVLEEERRWKTARKDFQRALLSDRRRLHLLFYSAENGIE